ncbi:hypothetical protein [Hyalangium minutum]|uniref:hypothetical protein n=1 Tax=Hyalangium minutum TaxID=394096 RepID=UPI0012FA720D|nr:hypothetical protein [Hyalangium minutum]
MAKSSRSDPSQAHLVLGHEGIAISADKKYAFFFPGDVPGGKWVRYRIIDKSHASTP